MAQNRASKTAYAVMIAALGLLGLAVLAYRGPGRALVRNYIGDAVAAAAVYFFVCLVSRRHFAGRVAIAAALVATVELLQLTSSAWRGNDILALVVGTTFDPIDLVLYLGGLAIAVAVDACLCGTSTSRTASRTQPPPDDSPSATNR